MAAAAPSLILGERPDGAARSRTPDDRQSLADLWSSWSSHTAGGTRVGRLRIEPDPPLTALAAAIEQHPAAAVALHDSELPPAFRSRLVLTLLRRRADRHGKQLILITGSSEARRLAEAAGLLVLAPTPRDGDSPSTHAAPLWPDDRPARGAGTSPAGPSPRAATVDRAQAMTGTAPALQRHAAGRSEGAAARFTSIRLELAPESAGPAHYPGPAAPSAPSRPAAVRTAAMPAAPALGATGSRRERTWGSRLGTTGWQVGVQLGLALGVAGRTAAARLARRLPERTAPLLLLGAATALLLLAIAYLLLPSGTVELRLAAEPWSVELPVTVDPAIKKPDLARGRLPGRVISKEVSDTRQAPATGRKTVPDAHATGEVVFVNRTDKTVTVPRGTVVLAGTVRFATQADVSVAGTTFGGPQQRFGMSRVAITAVEGGPAGNVDRFKIDRIEGPLSATLQVQNDAPTRGGTERAISYVTADDRKKLQDSLYQLLSDRLAQQLRSQLPNSEKETAVPWSGQNPAIVEATFSKNVDEEAQTLSLTLKLRYGATIFSNDAYNSFVQQLAAGRIAQLKPGYSLVSGTLKAEPPSVAGIENGAVQLVGRAQGTVVPRVDTGALRTRLANRTRGQADAYLGSLPGIVEYQLRVWPAWFGRLPWAGFRIAVHLSPR